jgi:hypothetical protein
MVGAAGTMNWPGLARCCYIENVAIGLGNRIPRCNAVRTAEHIEAGDAESGATALTTVLERLLTTGLNPSIFCRCQNHFLTDDLIDHITAASDADGVSMRKYPYDSARDWRIG